MSKAKHAGLARVARVFRAATVDGRHSLERIAVAVGRSYDLVYAWVRGRRAVPCYALPGIERATGDLGLIGELIGADEMGINLSRRQAPGVIPVADLRSAVLTATAALGRLAADAELALLDEQLDVGERVKLEQDLDDLGSKLETIRARVKQAPTTLVRKVSTR